MKKDTSPNVPQREKLQQKMVIKDKFVWTEKQLDFIDIALDKRTKIVICKAPAGVGKTLLAVYCSLKKMLEKKIGEIIYIRAPIEACSKGIGYLTGDKNQKMGPYLMPAMDHFRELLDQATINQLIAEQRIIIEPFGFIKGRTFNVSSCIADEAEDYSMQELELLMTRLGKFANLFIIGDLHQSNIKNSGFATIYDMFDTEEAKENGIWTFEFDAGDCLRNEMTKFIVETFEKKYKL